MKWLTLWCLLGVGLGLLALTPPAEASCFVRSRAVVIHKPAVVVKKVVEVPVAVFAPVPVYGAVYAAPAVVPAPPPAAAANTAPGGGDALQTIMFELRRLNSRIDGMERHMGLQPPTRPAAPRGELPPPKEPPPDGAAAAPKLRDEPKAHPALAILSAKCASCHAASVSDSKGGAFAMFEGGAPAKLSERQLRKVSTMVYTGRMPPRDSGHALSDAEVGQVMEWLDGIK